MKKLTLVILAISFAACSKNNDIVEQDSLDIIFELSVYNSQNEDLLNISTPNHLNESEIKLFYEVNGEINEVHNSNLYNPKNFKIYKHENEYRIKIYLNYTKTSDRPITYIQWNINDTDTIKTVFDRPGNSVLKRRVWLNEIEVWNWTSNEIGYYKLIK